MPLHKGAQPGSKEFGQNIATEIKAGKPAKQAEAIAYSVARGDADGDILTITVKDADGQLRKLLDHIKHAAGIGHSFEVLTDPGDKEYEKKFWFDGDGAFRIEKIETRADGITTFSLKDMSDEKFDALKTLIEEWIDEEKGETEHRSDYDPYEKAEELRDKIASEKDPDKKARLKRTLENVERELSRKMKRQDAAVPLISARDAARSLLPDERKVDCAMDAAERLAKKDAEEVHKQGDYTIRFDPIRKRKGLKPYAVFKEGRGISQHESKEEAIKAIPSDSRKDADGGQPQTREEIEAKLEGLKKRRDDIQSEERDGRLKEVEKEIAETEELLKASQAAEQDNGKLQHDGKRNAAQSKKDAEGGKRITEGSKVAIQDKTRKDGSKLDSIMARVDHMIKDTDNSPAKGKR